MPANTGTVGGVTLPLAAGSANSALDDPLLLGLLDYFAYWLNANLNTKLANMAGQPAEAVPAAARFPFDPERAFVRNTIPALYMWSPTTRIEKLSILMRRRVRDVRAIYVFSQQVIPDGALVQSGLGADIDGTFLQATQYGYHTAYSYGGGPVGKPIDVTLSIDEWQYLGATIGHMWKLPGEAALGPSGGMQGDGAVQRGYLAVQARWEVKELLGERDAAAETVTSTAAIQIDGETVVDRYVRAPKPDDDVEDEV